MTKKKLMWLSCDLANAIYDYKRDQEKKTNRWIPISRMKDVELVPKLSRDKKKNERYFEI